ncbi:MAG TPA: reverse transcriptase domain-containing protein [Solirubrobacteraceae bacterium]|nr:reverse transcriptase domain-containing protein [Solirubrobacteraceae bacterium]
MLQDERRYRRFEIVKRTGGTREIAAPLRPLKELQRRLAGHLEDWYSPPNHVTGYVRGRGPKPNAEPHRRQEWVLRVDLADFFPSIHIGRVRGMFMAKPFGFGRDAAAILAQLCCYRKALPQGAPTSPVISNIICRAMDREIAKLAASERCYFTRYADDLTFSTDRASFPISLAYIEGTKAFIGPSLKRVVNDATFSVNEEKTRLVRRWQRQRVTGFVINDRLNVPREYVREIRTLLYIWKRYGLIDAEASFARAAVPVNRPVERIDFGTSIRSRIQRVGDTKGWTDPVYRQLVDLLTPLDPDFIPIYERRQAHVPTNRRKAAPPLQLRVCVEGPTDVVHLTAAMSYFASQDEFARLELLFDEDSVYDGDAALAKHLAATATARPSVPTVCLFDRDNPSLLRKLRLHEQDVVHCGHNVAGVALVRPPLRKQPFCMELLYGDADLLARDHTGRRVYRREEFNLTTGHHNSEQCSDLNIKDRKIIREQVYAFGSDRNLALSKSSFAELIAERRTPFIPDFAGFRPTIAALMRLAETFVGSR